MKHSPRFLKFVEETRRHVHETTIAEVQRRLAAGEKLLLVDVREESEWAEGHLPNAVHLGKGILERDVETRFPQAETELILYCGGGYRSAIAADNLQKMGYQKVLSMDGGFRGWTESGGKVVKD